ncbi:MULTISPECIES: protein phosphatase 2C domain-containing protein [unclassified Spirosoma]|uniref:PP2C family protein-serine/threonine phosphatase n=1 Tax=unclassified Spirosoma TaxID=2621999 RepID=UPI00095DCE8B|nr:MULTISPECIES: protein phosphatase 2C domain-containing protein [unclassified Spirosoma]MBN8825852.1 serine/threonine-protein phosphatase [Spirosoma sp.]OJW70548.1 MAG: serine/threonine protein phosphatase [Spirosoma sp. 48-14]
MNSIVFTGRTDVGRRRTDNQDAFLCATIWAETSALLAVIDGVGGYAGGDRAAAIARESIEQYMAAPNGNPLSMLREAVVFANNQIYRERQQELRLANMCCVLTTAIADSQSSKLYFVHVGDTRLYRYRQGILEKLTYDHSLVGVREDAQELTEAEAMQHPRRNEILRDVGSAMHRVDDPDFLESGETDFLPGDQLLLCSDGLTDLVTQAQIKAVLEQKQSLDEQTAELVRLANQQGGSDNITVVLAKNNGGIDEPAANKDANKGTQASTLKQPGVVVAAVADTPTSASSKPGRKRSVGFLVLVGLIVISLITAIVWYQNQPSGQSDSAAADSVLTTNRQPSDSSVVVKPDGRLDSLVQMAYRSKEHRLILSADTFRLSKPLLVTDSLQGILGGNRPAVLLPADSTKALLALQIVRSGKVQLENIIISGFKTGIEVTQGTRLQLSNVSFQNVELPVRAAIRQENFRKAVITLSVENQPDSTKTRHQ